MSREEKIWRWFDDLGYKGIFTSSKIIDDVDIEELIEILEDD